MCEKLVRQAIFGNNCNSSGNVRTKLATRNGMVRKKTFVGSCEFSARKTVERVAKGNKIHDSGRPCSNENWRKLQQPATHRLRMTQTTSQGDVG